jgi:hypothetical protein
VAAIYSPGPGSSLGASVNASGVLTILSSPPPGASFYSLTPCRLVDTRRAAGSLGGPALSAGQRRSFIAAGSCGVPASARSLSVNVTATGAAADGFLRFQPSGSPTPTVSTLNFAAGQTRAGNAVLDLGSGGNFDATFGAASGAVDLVVDVAGDFE